MPRLTKAITSFNCLISLVVWLPAWLKMFRTHSAHDYALLSLLIILWLQASNLFIACVEKSKSLRLYLLVNTASVAFTVGMVWWFQR